MTIKKVLVLTAFAGILFSCSDDEPALPKGDYDNGILVTHEGAFSGGTGTVNYISDDFSVEERAIFNKVNSENIGTILQSAAFHDEDIYLIANVGNKISVANRYTMEKSTEITADLSNPRYMAFSQGKGFVTNWGEGSDATDDYVAVVNLSSHLVEATIPVAEGPEQIIAYGNKLYVTHKGGWGSGNSVTVINASNNSVEATIDVGDIPDEMIINSNGDLIISCEGRAITPWNPNEVLGSLVKINTVNNTVSSTITFDSGFHPNELTIYENELYISTGSEIYKMSENATQLPASSIVSTTVSGMSVHDDKIFVTDVKDFMSNGTLTIFDANTNTQIRSFDVGLIPRKIYFN